MCKYSIKRISLAIIGCMLLIICNGCGGVSVPDDQKIIPIFSGDYSIELTKIDVIDNNLNISIKYKNESDSVEFFDNIADLKVTQGETYLFAKTMDIDEMKKRVEAIPTGSSLNINYVFELDNTKDDVTIEVYGAFIKPDNVKEQKNGREVTYVTAKL